MPEQRKYLKKTLANQWGLRLKPGRLLGSMDDVLLVATRLANTHRDPDLNPHKHLDKDTVVEKLTELIGSCHAARELMLETNRMNELLWCNVRAQSRPGPTASPNVSSAS